jgi:uncharacterized protein YbjT (DUF2867 family)
MILVAGGTGRLGSLVVADLVAAGLPVRVLTRDPSRARHLASAVEVVGGDVRDRGSVERAVTGASLVVSAVHGFAGPGRVTPDSVDRRGNANLVDAAAAAGADLVLVSGIGASADSPMELFRAKFDAEQHLHASGAASTVVRASAFVELWAEIMTKPIVLGRGENPINFVSVHDVAAVVAHAAVDTGWRGRTFEVGGPRNLTFCELAALLQDVRGDDRTVRHVPRALLRALSPFVRKARAAVVMDTVDMTFDATTSGLDPALFPVTDLRDAIARTVGEGSVRA